MTTQGTPTATSLDWGPLLEAEPHAAGWIDADGRYRCLNTLLRQLLGLPDAAGADDEAVGRPRHDVLRIYLAPRVQRPEPLLDWLDHLAQGGTQSIELVLRERGMPERIWRYWSRPVRRADGTLLGWREALIEVTQERRLHDRCEALDRQVAGLQREMQEQLACKDEMIARVSHELRTPLTAIIGFCHMLLGYTVELQPQQANYVHKVLKNASILLQLLNNVLDLAKMETGPLAVSREPVELDVLLQEAIETVEPQVWEKDVRLSADLPPESLMLVSDRLKLKQILVNLLSNAIKYTDAGEVRVTCLPEGGGYTVRVEDTGIGIPDDQFERIFEPYVQVETVRPAQRLPSTGLGLAISRRLAALLHGRIEVDSEVGRGSCFSLWVPSALPEVDPGG